MRTVIGVELGPESCVVVRVRPAGDRVELSLVKGLRDDDWDPRRPLAENLADARRSGRLPRTARVVAWGLPQSEAATDPADPTTRTLVSPLREAGFEVETVMSPAQALALLARRRPRPAGRGGTIWLALNRQGAAIAILDGGELLYSREFNWHYRPGASVKEELLQRYSLVAHLAPEVRHGLEIVRATRDVAVGSVVTCGDLPDLRSLTMPLIEELDIEVETLDTLEGMDVSRLEGRDDVADRASALCLAVAVGAGAPSGSGVARLRPWLTAAAVVLLVVGGWLVGRTFTSSIRPSPSPSPAPAVSPSATRPDPAATLPPPAATAPAASAESGVESPTLAATLAARPDGTPGTAAESSQPAATSGRRAAPAASGMDTGPSSAPPRVAASPVLQRGRPAPGRVRPVAQITRPLTVPLPQVNSILVAPDRRLAVVGGEIVREGDAVGPRVLVRIEPDAVVLREPSGHEVRVPIRRKLS